MTRTLGAALLGAIGGAGLVFVWVSFLSGPDAALPTTRDIQIVSTISEREAQNLREARYETLNTVEQIMALPTSFARGEAMYALAGRSAAGQLQAHLFDAIRISDDTERDQALGILFHRLVELDPQSALALSRLEDFPKRRQFERSVWQLWSRSDFESALAAASEISEPAGRERAAQGLFAANGFLNTTEVERIIRVLGVRPDRQNRHAYVLELIERSPEQAFAFVNSLPMSMESRDALGSIATYFAQQSDLDVTRYTNLIDDANQRRQFRQWVDMFRAQKNPEASLRQLLDSPNRDDPSQVMTAAQSLAAQDLDAALRLFEEARPQNTRMLMAMGIGQAYASKDPVAAIAWAREYSGELNSLYGQDILSTVLMQVARVDAELALSEIRSMPISQRRDQIQQQILFQIVETQPERTPEFLDQLAFSNANQAPTRHMLITMWASKDPAGASGWVLANRGSMNPRELAGIGQAIAGADLDTAKRLLPQIEGPAARSWRNSIAGQLINTGSFDEAHAFIEQFRGEADYQQMKSNYLQMLSQADPARAEQLARQMPAGAPRDAVLQAMVMNVSRHSPQKAEQLLDMMTDQNARIGAVSTLAQYKASQDPASAARWAMSRPTNDERDAAVSALLGSTSMPEAEVDRLLDALTSVEQRQAAESAYITRLAYQNNATAARQRLARSNLPDEMKAELERQISAVERSGMGFGGVMYGSDF